MMYQPIPLQNFIEDNDDHSPSIYIGGFMKDALIEFSYSHPEIIAIKGQTHEIFAPGFFINRLILVPLEISYCRFNFCRI